MEPSSGHDISLWTIRIGQASEPCLWIATRFDFHPTFISLTVTSKGRTQEFKMFEQILYFVTVHIKIEHVECGEIEIVEWFLWGSTFQSEICWTCKSTHPGNAEQLEKFATDATGKLSETNQSDKWYNLLINQNVQKHSTETYMSRGMMVTRLQIFIHLSVKHNRSNILVSHET